MDFRNATNILIQGKDATEKIVGQTIACYHWRMTEYELHDRHRGYYTKTISEVRRPGRSEEYSRESHTYQTENLLNTHFLHLNTFLLLFATFLAQNLAIAANPPYGIVGDMGKWNSNSEMVRDSMLRMNTKNLIMPGDNLYIKSQGYKTVWAPWTSNGFIFSYIAIGNHHLTYEEEVAFFNMPAEYFASVDQENDIRFIILNADNENNVEEQMAFLKKQLGASKNKFNFIMYHHPSFTVSDHHKWEEKREFHQAIREIIRENANVISGIIWGHDHLAATFDFEGIPVFLSGSSQQPRSGVVQPENMGFQFNNVWLATPGKPYWLKLEAVLKDGNGFLLKYIRAQDDHVMCTMRLVAPHSISYQSDCLTEK